VPARDVPPEHAASAGPTSTARNQTGPELRYELNPKHGTTQRGRAAAAPRSGQAALENSVQFGPTSSRRVAADVESQEFVVFHEHRPGVFHGHVREWEQLDAEMQNALVRTGRVTRQGRIISAQSGTTSALTHPLSNGVASQPIPPGHSATVRGARPQQLPLP
jgi:hypothetical protein